MQHRGLDGFRFVAFLAVFLFHLNLLPAGYLGVQAFFVLSGFLLTPILVEMRDQLPPRSYLLNFYGRRSLRIFPLYYAYLAIVGAVSFVALANSRLASIEALHTVREQFIFAITYTYDFFHASHAYQWSPLLTHFWSLAVEEQFYLVWPFLILLVPGVRLRHVLLGIVIAGPFIRWLEAAAIGTAMGGQLAYSQFDLVIYVLPFSHVDAFATGGLLALYSRAPSGGRLLAYATGLAVVGLLTARVATGDSELLALGFTKFMADSGKFVWAYTGFNLLFGWSLLKIRDRALVPAFMEHGTVAYLGKISYGLYVYHFGVIWAVSMGMDFYGKPALWRAIIGVGVLIVTVLVSMASYAFIEAPFLRLKDRYFPVRRPAPAVAGVAGVAGVVTSAAIAQGAALWTSPLPGTGPEGPYSAPASSNSTVAKDE